MTVTVKSADGGVVWGQTLTAVVSGEPEGAELAYDWQVWSDADEQWQSYGAHFEEGRARGLTTKREWTGLVWRCVVTADADGEQAMRVASDAVGPIASKDVKVKGMVRYYEPLRVGSTLSVELELPEGAEALVRWKRAASPDGEFAYIDGAEGAEYTLGPEDVGAYIACRVDATGVGYVFDGDTLEVPGPVLVDDGSASGGGTDAGSVDVVYVCDSAGEAWYHRYDCDELSRLRRRGYAVREVSLDEARRSFTACPYCMG